MKIPITGAQGILPTDVTAIYTAPSGNSGSAFSAIENISFTNTVDDDDFHVTIYKGKSSSMIIVWDFKFNSQVKTAVTTDEIRLLYGDSIFAVCDKSTVQYVINGYYEITQQVNTNPAVRS